MKMSNTFQNGTEMAIGTGYPACTDPCGRYRSSLIAVKAMLEVKEEMAPYMDIQLVAFPQEGIHSYPNGAELLEESLKMGVDVVGGIPHFEFTREYGVDSMKVAFDLAEKYDRLIDIHCDEIDDEQSRFVEVVAKEAYRTWTGFTNNGKPHNSDGVR